MKEGVEMYKNKKQFWYIGGHLSIEENLEFVIKRYLNMVIKNYTKWLKHSQLANRQRINGQT